MRGLLLSYGPEAVKRRVWDTEYRREKWPMRQDTRGDCVYAHLERFAQRGRILDLGCGSGNTGTEIADSAYREYVGVDISEAALDKARRSTRESGREAKNHFACSDFLVYRPEGEFDVILFRESMYHVPVTKVGAILAYYGQFLKPEGVFIVRMYAACTQTGRIKKRPMTMLRTMEEEFDLIERREYAGHEKPTVMVFRPRRAQAAPNPPEQKAAADRHQEPAGVAADSSGF